tara:strand:- start:1222 stop:3447 length:2226 start_codon:yes stop_codon:yes gene_type:complete
MYDDYFEAGLRIFGVHGVKDEVCGCGNPECKAFFKHPKISNWQYTPQWSQEQFENMEEFGQFKSGFGVLVNGMLVVDVDARNGGVESFKRLLALVPAIKDSGFIVNTGSGGGSQHYYFKLSEPVAMVQTHKEFAGIDFKSSGFVIGAGSIHASGDLYEAESGDPSKITEAPRALIELLRKPERHRAIVDGESVDVSDKDLRDMVAHISPDCDYETWYRVGMAIHHATQGAGYSLWDDWSTGGKDYPGHHETDKKWQSFGKSGNPVGLGTLIHYAREGGYIDDSVEFTPTVQFSGGEDVVDLLRPPGFVGELCQWINGQCHYKRESLAVAAALVAVSNLAGMRYRDELDGFTPNMMAFCVAGSGTGKEAIGKAFLKVMTTAGIGAAVHGGFKSEQELYRNLLRHQPAYYSVDELGIQLGKVKNAAKGGASYLEGLLGAVMSVYSKADSSVLITGDLKEEVRAALGKEYASIIKQLDGGSKNADLLERKLKTVEGQLSSIDQGIEAPYLSLIGYTTPVTFDGLFDFEQATNGFLARAVIFTEKDNNPRYKTGFKRPVMTDKMEVDIINLYSMGQFSVAPDTRLEFRGEKTGVPTDPEAAVLLEEAKEFFWQLAAKHDGSTGLTAIPRRGYEMAAKISLVLALPSGVRTVEHVRYGIALAKKDIGDKLMLASTNTADSEEERLAAKIITLLDKDEPTKLGTLVNKSTRSKNHTKEMVPPVLIKLVKAKMIIEIEKNNFKSYLLP